MDIELLFNKILRKNYKKAIECTTKEECDAFLDSLAQRERMELIIHCDEFVLTNRLKIGRPVKEYFLLHLEEYLTEDDEKSKRMAHSTLNLITFISAIVAIVVYLLMK